MLPLDIVLLGLLLFIAYVLLNDFIDLFLTFFEEFLERDSLSDDVALHGLFLQPLEFEKPLFFCLSPSFFQDGSSAVSNSGHELWLQQIVEGIQLKALMEQVNINLACEAQQTDGLILDLGNQSFIILILCGNQLCDEVLSISLSDCV